MPNCDSKFKAKQKVQRRLPIADVLLFFLTIDFSRPNLPKPIDSLQGIPLASFLLTDTFQNMAMRGMRACWEIGKKNNEGAWRWKAGMESIFKMLSI